MRISPLSKAGTFALVAGATLATVAANATPAITGPVDLSNFTTGANYGPPAGGHFTEPGPITVNSGTATPIYTGPDYANIDSLLLVISAASIPMGDVITLTWGNLAPIVFNSTDFTSGGGFPAHIGGLGNGQVNGVSFPGSVHAGADVTGLPTGLATDAFLANVTISQTIATNLRVDVFSDLNGKIVGNAANSGAIGVTGSTIATAEPAIFGLFGLGVAGMALARRKRG